MTHGSCVRSLKDLSLLCVDPVGSAVKKQLLKITGIEKAFAQSSILRTCLYLEGCLDPLAGGRECMIPLEVALAGLPARERWHKMTSKSPPTSEE